MKNNKKYQTKIKYSKRTPEQKAARRKLTSRIFIGVTVALVLVFFVFLFVTTNFMGTDNIVTETAVKTRVSDTISTTGFVVREEHYINNDKEGVFVYQLNDSDKVTAGGAIANIYEEESDAINSQRIKEIDEEIAELETLNDICNSVNVGLDSVNNQLDLKLTQLIENVNKHNFVNISESENNLLSAINRKQIITGDQKNFDKNIKELKKEKSKLEDETAESIGTVTTEKSGYFVSSVDGYESVFSIKDLDNITYADISNAKAKEIDESKYIGKVISGINWYLVCPVTAQQAVAITHNSVSVNVKIPYATTESIPARVVRVNQSNDKENAVVILECNYMSPALSQIRNEAVEIELNTYEGLKVSKVAIHDDYVTTTTSNENGEEVKEDTKVQGVYVKYGRQIEFKQVFIIYSSDDYVICSESSVEDLAVSGDTLALYDEVIIEGDDLYDGKLID